MRRIRRTKPAFAYPTENEYMQKLICSRNIKKWSECLDPKFLHPVLENLPQFDGHIKTMHAQTPQNKYRTAFVLVHKVHRFIFLVQHNRFGGGI